MRRWAFRIEVTIVSLIIAAWAMTTVYAGFNLLRGLF